ncbi:MAG: hypothetical protein KA164_23380 [Rhodoferax sp.]|nr:hypothetical protein [Rhodoferax sp.]
MKKLLVITLLAIGVGAAAQTSAAKKELITKILQLQQPAIEGMARGMAEQPALVLLQRAGSVMQTRTPPDKREAIGKEIQADARKYVEDVLPVIRDRAVKLAPTTVGVLLEERFTEDDLKQLVAIIENPVYRKYQQMDGEMTRSLQAKLVTELRPTLEPKLKSLELAVAGRLGIPVTAPAAPSSARPPAKAASN